MHPAGISLHCAAVSTSRRATVALLTALAASLFFTLTYVLNRSMAVDGGHWAWTASLRYLVTLPLLVGWVALNGGWPPLWRELRRHPGPWLLWSAVGFGLFYTCMSYAAASGPSWLVASSFQLTVLAGPLLAPFLYDDHRRFVPRAVLGLGAVIVCGVLLMQFGVARGAFDLAAWIALGCMAVSAITYPLGNRMVLLHLERSDETLDATQRVTGMTLASLPCWLLLAGYGLNQSGWPAWPQVAQAGGVAVSAGIIATVLFFRATAMVRHDPVALAAVEATQAAEMLFATLLGVLFLGERWPGPIALSGGLLIVAGVMGLSRLLARPERVGETTTEGRS